MQRGKISHFILPLVVISLSVLLMLGVGRLWIAEISYIYPGPAMATASLVIVVLLVGFGINGLVTENRKLNARLQNHLPQIIGLEILVERWQELKAELTERDSTMLYEQLVLAQQTFAEKEVIRLTFKKCFAGGKPEKSVILVQPLGMEPQVLKFDNADNINKEIHRYTDCVAGRLGGHAPGKPLYHWVEPKTGYGTIVYELAQRNKEADLRTFGQYYAEESSAETVIDTLNQILKIMKQWWNQELLPNDKCSGQNGVSDSLYDEYSRLKEHFLKIRGYEEKIKQKFGSNLIIEPQQFYLSDGHWQTGPLCNPLNWVEGVFCEPKEKIFNKKCGYLDNLVARNRSIVHGDFHTGNILIETEAKQAADESQKTIWIIDFPHTHVGPAVQDMARLEADIKFGLLPDERLKQLGIRGIYEFETALLPPPDNPAIPLPIPMPERDSPIAEPHFQKAWAVVDRLRQETRPYVGGDARFYYLALLYATLPILYYRDRSPWQKLYAFISAALLCERLGG